MASIPERFVDGFGEVSLKHGMVRIELLSLSGPEAAPTERLIMSVRTLVQVLQIQQSLVERLTEAGVLRATEPSPATEAPAEADSDGAAPGEHRPRTNPTLAPPTSPNFTKR